MGRRINAYQAYLGVADKSQPLTMVTNLLELTAW